MTVLNCRESKALARLGQGMKITMAKWLFPVLATVLAGCAASNKPINAPLQNAQNTPVTQVSSRDLADDSLFIGLAFSGGGHRASSFSYGMLKALQSVDRSPSNPHGLLPHVRLVTGVSGGSVTAAWFGFSGPAGMNGFRERYLTQNAEKYMANSPFNPLTIARGLSGGANGRKTFGRFLNEALFNNATFADLARRSKIITWINAADVAHKTSFLFSPETFDALCSDLSRLPISEAVAASAAFPLVFSPIVLQAHSNDCNYQEPDWLTAARYNPEATSTLRAYGDVIERYSDPEKVKFVKLLDGGTTDNFGTVALAVERAKAQNAYGPLTAEQAVRVERILFLVANSGTESEYGWTQKVGGPGGVALAMSIVNSSMSSATRTAYDAMVLTLNDWHSDVVEFRCSLSSSEVRRLRGSTSGWDCRNLKLFVSEVTFQGLDDDMVDQLNEIPTRLKLPVEQVDLAIEAGLQATRQDPEFNGFLRSIGLTGPAIGDAAGATPRLIRPNQN